MTILNDAELWLGQKRVGEELKGNVEYTDMYLEPISKVRRDHALTNSEFYTVSCGNDKWTCEYLSTVGNGINLRVKNKIQ